MKFFFTICFLIILFACNQKTEQTVKDRFDSIEKIVGTANWQLVDNGDTSYIYFSRMGDANFNVYDYTLLNGDSVNSRMNNILAQQDSIIWNRENERWLLTKVTDTTIVWRKNEKDQYTIMQKDSLHLSLVFPDGHKAALKRTLPLATFLVRSHYDYLHGTRTVDSPIVPPRHRLKK